MEEEVVSRRSRRSRSTSKPPSTEIVVPAAAVTAHGVQQEIVVKLTRLHKETIYHAESQVNEMTTTFVSQQATSHAAVHNDDDVTVEIQNKQNSNQEAAVVTHTSSKVVQKKSKQGSSVNGSPTKKTTKKRVVATESMTTSSEQSQQASTSSDTQEKSLTGTRRTRTVQKEVFTPPPKEDRARKFYESVQRGEVDVSQSVFVRFYKPLEDWWNYYPKTDNTYSPLSTCRYELAPGMMAMPNLSRRSIHTGQRSFTSSLSQRRSRVETQVDSDTEDWEQTTRTSVVVQRRQTSVWQRITTTIWTVTTLIYAYTFGALFGMEARGMTRHGHATRVPLLLRPIAWLMHLARQLTLLEVTIFSSLSRGQRRNLLLALLLFLLLAVPAYILYKGGYEYPELNMYLAEIHVKAVAPTLEYLSYVKDTVGFYAWNVTVPYLHDLREKIKF